MDREKVAEQMKGLKAKAKAARKEGKRDAAAAFKSGAKRLRRRLAAASARGQRKKKKGDA
jgi:hypothetical protein